MGGDYNMKHYIVYNNDKVVLYYQVYFNKINNIINNG